MTNAERVTASTDTGDLHWVGPSVVAVSRGLDRRPDSNGHVEMYAPNPRQPGSSVSHFSTGLSPDELMEPSYTVPLHDVGLAKELLADIGWLTSLPLTLSINQSLFRSGNTLRVGLRAQNPGVTVNVDFYFGVLLPDGVNMLFVTSLSPLNGVVARLDADPRTFPPSSLMFNSCRAWMSHSWTSLCTPSPVGSRLAPMPPSPCSPRRVPLMMGALTQATSWRLTLAHSVSPHEGASRWDEPSRSEAYGLNGLPLGGV